MRVIIIGAGSAGLLTALVVKNKMPGCEVIVISDSNTKVIGVGESTVGSFCEMLETSAGINLKEFFEKVKPIPKNGLVLNFGKNDFHYVFSTSFDFQLYTQDLPVGFYFDGGMFGQNDLSKNIVDRNNDVDVDVSGALHVDNDLFLTYLKTLSIERGIKFVTDRINSIEREGDDIISLNKKHIADFFIDCSGFKPLLSKEKFYSYEDMLVNDRALFFRTKTKGKIRMYTKSSTMNSGWLWEIDHSTGYTGNGYVYSSKYITEKEVLKEVEQKLKIKIDDYKVIPFKTGRLEKHWVGNVITIGNADMFVEPLEATSLMIILKLSTDVIEIIKYGNKKGDLIERYNKFTNDYLDTIRDFIFIHFCFNGKLNTSYWKDYKKRFNLLPKDSITYKFLEYYLINGSHIKYLTHLCSNINPFEVEGYWSIFRGLIPSETDRKKWSVILKKVYV